MEKGTIFKFHNDLDTDQIIASQYAASEPGRNERTYF